MALTEKLTAVADAIRGKTGKTEEMTLDQMATEIAGIETGGGYYIYKQLVQGTMTVFSSNDFVSLKSYLFHEDKVIEEINLPNCTTVGMSIFRNATKLKKVLMNASPTAASFVDCTALEALIIPSNTLVKLKVSNAFTRSAIATGTGYIYVPSALLEEYKTETNWSVYADRFRSIEGSEYE